MGLLKTIFFIIIFFYAFKFLAKLFAPFLIKKATDTIKKKAEQQFRGQQGTQQEPSVKEGETIIDKKPVSGQESKKSVGDYVDFEEID
ncbi:MAG: putative membrane protein [Polaribacter sp.]|jgi:predicted membrane protein|tara:strand:- start:242 stop:505 length:264 start_codon:yes stop_codon:yes gene_type:complete